MKYGKDHHFEIVMKEIERDFKNGEIDVRFDLDGNQLKKIDVNTYFQTVEFNLAESNASMFYDHLQEKLRTRLQKFAKKMFDKKYGKFTHLKSKGKI